MRRIIICDDNEADRKHIREVCEKYFASIYEQIEIKEFKSGQELLRQPMEATVIFLDIEMKKMTGIDVKNILGARANEVPIVFLTNYKEYMSRAFGKNVYGYMDKPADAQQIYKILTQILDEERDSERITVKKLDGDCLTIPTDRIYYIEGKRRYSIVYTAEGSYMMRKPLREWIEELPPDEWAQAQKSYLVNLREITGTHGEIQLRCGKIIPIGGIYRKEFFEKYDRYADKRWRFQ
ncbi:MAG: response regulator transcription factor [Lachnospiraceae bacterium]|nr:response regulator transcription factor [Lachnospiraceae bacterium]